MSPPLVVALRARGPHRHRPRQGAARRGHRRASRSSSRTSGRRTARSPTPSARPSSRRCSRSRYGVVFEGDERWRKLDVPKGDTYVWDAGVDLHQAPALLRGDDQGAGAAAATLTGARVLAVLGDSVTTDHISPAGIIKKDGPAGQYLVAHGVDAKDFNTYGSRRGNHEVMVRGTFANVRLRNLLAPGTEGGVTRHLPDGEAMSIFDASREVRRREGAAVHPRRQGVRQRVVARLGGQGAAAAGRARRDRRELRAHPPQQPGRHGDPAAAVPGRARPPPRWASPARRSSRRSGCRRCSTRASPAAAS